ncbi:hypothetical protein E2C01_099883 [Portunus trituberculatus]|uniref:Uncharacterized protein n=1 Tax=Portunus trituberculatus TaxID=210409 RepID=A0A5B7KGH9_PORTR|nr:hypothetical protein [Portunus trituberculatus]
MLALLSSLGRSTFSCQQQNRFVYPLSERPGPGLAEVRRGPRLRSPASGFPHRCLSDLMKLSASKARVLIPREKEKFGVREIK